jgi:hypothetical protein
MDLWCASRDPSETWILTLALTLHSNRRRCLGCVVSDIDLLSGRWQAAGADFRHSSVHPLNMGAYPFRPVARSGMPQVRHVLDGIFCVFDACLLVSQAVCRSRCDTDCRGASCTITARLCAVVTGQGRGHVPQLATGSQCCYGLWTGLLYS